MEQNEIIEGNKLIAEFMGYVKTEKEVGEATYKGQEKGTIVWASHLKYHTSWDWLMPVVEKIHKEGKEENVWQSNEFFRVDNLAIWAGLEATWLAVVEFIKWHQNK